MKSSQLRCNIVTWLGAITLIAGCGIHPAVNDASCTDCGSGVMSAPTSAAATISPYDIDGVWQTDTGRQIRLADLRGTPRVFAMFFAGCEGSCTLTLEELKRIEASLPAASRSRVGFVMVTFDPAIDTAAKLAEYRASRALSSNWTLLRGNATDTAALARSLGLTYAIEKPHRVVHSNGITVIDSDGKITNQQLGLHADLNRAIAAINSGE